MKRRKFLAYGVTVVLLLTGLTFLITSVGAAAQILPYSSSANSVSASDSWVISCLQTTSAGVASIIAPTGNSLTFTGQSAAGGGAACGPGGWALPSPCNPAYTGAPSFPKFEKFDFAGIHQAGATMYSAPTLSGPIIGGPADGTWQVTGGITFIICFSIAGKTTTISYAPTLAPCFYNWRSAGANYPTTGFVNCGGSSAEQTTNNAVFFSDQGSGDSSPQPFTTNFVTTCPASTTVNGLWLRGATQTGNTYTKFASVDGPVLFQNTNVSALVGASTTATVNAGAGANGVSSAAIAYNNAAGTSYQLVAWSGALGTWQFGAILFSPPSQCAITPPAIAITDVHQEDTFSLTVSQAQCNGDETSFSVDIEQGNVLTIIASLIIFVEDANTGTTVLSFSPQFAVGNRVQYDSKELPVGEYTALAKLILTGVGAGVFFDSAAFNVPQGACGNTAVDTATIITGVTNVINRRDANLTRIEARVNTTCQKTTDADCEGIKLDLVPISAQVNETEAHTDDLLTQQVAQRTAENASFGDLNNHFHQTDSYVNLTRGDIANLQVTVDELEIDMDATEANVVAARTDLNTTLARLADLDFHAHLIGGYINSTRSELRFRIDASQASANASFGDLNNHFHQTDSYINSTYQSLLGNITRICSGGSVCNVTLNSTDLNLTITSAFTASQRPIADAIFQFLWIVVLAVAIFLIFKTEWTVARYISVVLFTMSIFIGLAAFGSLGMGWNVMVLAAGILGIGVAAAQKPHESTG